MKIVAALALILTAYANTEVPITCQKDGDLALTFDGGPSMHTGQLLGILAKHNVKASFHFTPANFDNPVIQAYVKRAAADGHLLGLYINDPKYAQKEIDRGRTALQRYAGRTLKFVRVPTPLPDEKILKAITAQGLMITSFNFDSMDYLAANNSVTEAQGSVYWAFKEMFDAIEPPAKGAFISVQRDMVPASVAATNQIIAYAKKRGYNFVRLDECIQAVPETPNQNSDAADENSNHPTKPQSSDSSKNSLDLAVLFVACLIVLLEM
jgi:peptidoglycan/xylan/chitin deacetylase (PgdA/CDA1 family)